LLDNNSGNSSCQDRKEVLELCLQLTGKERIGLLIGDREFVGHQWFKYMKDNGLNFVMRLPKHHLIHRPDGQIQTITALNLSVDKPLLLTDCLVDGVVGQVWVKALAGGEYLFLFGTVKVEYMGQLYRKRWTIESVFQNLKQRGFDLEKTHLKDSKKLKKLIAMVSIAYGVCVSMGIYHHNKVQKIKNKKHGYKANSFARKGINLIREFCRKNNHLPPRVENRILSLLRWIKIQLIHYQHLKIAG
jgi:transposase